MRVSILVPWRATDTRRLPRLGGAIRFLANECYDSLGSSFTLHVHLNGTGGSTLGVPLSIAQIRSFMPADLPVIVTASPVEGKVPAIYAGAELAIDCRANVLVVVDNDVYLRPGAIASLLRTYRISGGAAASATKAPWVGGEATNFERVYSFAVLESFRHGLFPKRPTGSFYAVDPYAVHEVFRIGCADGDGLAEIGARQSGVTVFSPYARTFPEEVSRRVRHYRASEAQGVSRLHSHPQFLREALQARLPATVDRGTFVESLLLWRHVHEVASTTAQVEASVDLPGEMRVIGQKDLL